MREKKRLKQYETEQAKLQARADKLYSSMPEAAVKIFGSKSDEVQGKFYGFLIDNINNKALKKLAEKHVGIEAAENLHMSKKEYYMNTDYASRHEVFNNYKEVNSELQPYLKEKITEQLGKDKLDTTKGVYIDEYSDSSKNLAQALIGEKDFMDIIKENRKKLKNNLHINSSISFKNDNFHKDLGKADILDMHINKHGDLDLLVTDTYDFNPNESSILIKAARQRQERGEIIPYFIIYHAIIPKKALKY